MIEVLNLRGPIINSDSDVQGMLKADSRLQLHWRHLDQYVWPKGTF